MISKCSSTARASAASLGLIKANPKISHNIALAVDPELLSFDDGDTVTIEFKEDSDPCNVNDQDVNDQMNDKAGLQIDVPTAWTPDDKKTHMVKRTLSSRRITTGMEGTGSSTSFDKCR